jgi:tRNA-dihydrouridine synthase B
MALYHLKQITLLKGEDVGIKEMRKHIAWYLKGLPGSSVIKAEVFKLDQVEDVKKMLHTYLLELV